MFKHIAVVALSAIACFTSSVSAASGSYLKNEGVLQCTDGFMIFDSKITLTPFQPDVHITMKPVIDGVPAKINIVAQTRQMANAVSQGNEFRFTPLAAESSAQFQMVGKCKNGTPFGSAAFIYTAVDKNGKNYPIFA